MLDHHEACRDQRAGRSGEQCSSLRCCQRWRSNSQVSLAKEGENQSVEERQHAVARGQWREIGGEKSLLFTTGSGEWATEGVSRPDRSRSMFRRRCELFSIESRGPRWTQRISCVGRRTASHAKLAEEDSAGQRHGRAIGCPPTKHRTEWCIESSRREWSSRSFCPRLGQSLDLIANVDQSTVRSFRTAFARRAARGQSQRFGERELSSARRLDAQHGIVESAESTSTTPIEVAFADLRTLAEDGEHLVPSLSRGNSVRESSSTVEGRLFFSQVKTETRG